MHGSSEYHSLNDNGHHDDYYVNIDAYCAENINDDDINLYGFTYVTEENRKRCTVPLTILREQPYWLEEYESITCRVYAVNQRGRSAAGYGAGAFMPKLGTVPSPPIGVFTRLV